MAVTPPLEWKRLDDDEDLTPIWQHVSDPVLAMTWNFALLDHLHLALCAFCDPTHSGLVLPYRPSVSGQGGVWTGLRGCG